MAAGREVVVVSGVRTAVGKYGGSLKDMPPADLGAAVVREAVSRSGLEPAADRQPDPSGAAGDERDLTIHAGHRGLPFCRGTTG